MADVLTKQQRSFCMSRIRSQNTKPELTIEKELRKRKIYFARNVKKIFGKPDFVFRRKKIVIFVDSDFWHGHPTRFVLPKSNSEFWEKKIDRNILRDKLVNKTLKKDGWKVLRFWEIDIKKDLEKILNRILKTLDT